ncbi:hypothetical protein NM688_g3663 [Phlebia brevispora]|uniref:Uncharacterized protein n=1 Tax=Phlebia brevispora TaxID=194682 RepID=A0ACC1T504_9APHY|nr:hypothetical protein NM688_g3663 [Phlebia brevispora]
MPRVLMSMVSLPLSQYYAQNYLNVVSVAIVYYDHLITLNDEQRYVWQRRGYAGSWLFYFHRYFTLALYYVDRYFFTMEICPALIEFIVTSNMFLRVYALYGRDRRVLALGVLMYTVTIALCVWGFTGHDSIIVVDFGCHIVLSTGNKLAAAWEALLVLDVLIFVLTVCRTYTVVRARSEGLLTSLFKDGTTYYVILTCVNMANVLTFYVSNDQAFLPDYAYSNLRTAASSRIERMSIARRRQVSFISLDPCFVSVINNKASISTTMLSRMMLNLHKSASRDMTLSTKVETSATTLGFLAMRIVDSVEGEELQDHSEDATGLVDTDSQ